MSVIIKHPVTDGATTTRDKGDLLIYWSIGGRRSGLTRGDSTGEGEEKELIDEEGEICCYISKDENREMRPCVLSCNVPGPQKVIIAANEGDLL